MDEDTRTRIQRLATDYAQIEFVSMEGKLQSITDRMSNCLRCDYFTLTIYFRILIPAMFPEYKKGIYVDSDIVVPGDISELYQIELGDNLLAACPDFSIRGIPEFMHYLEASVGVDGMQYFNSGVLLMNMEELRRVEIDRRFLELLDTYHFGTVAPDQDYLNAMCYGRVVFLDEEWDVMPKEQGAEFENPKLIHYNLFSKPWCYDGIQYEEYFWKYAKDCGFYEELLEHKRNYSDEQKKSDSDSLVRMVQSAVELSNAEQNFRTVFNSGKEERL